MRNKFLARVALVTALVPMTYFSAAGQNEAGKVKIDIPKAGPEQKALEPLIGTWHAKIKAWVDPSDPKEKPRESTGIMVRKWLLDGRFMQEQFEYTFFDVKLQGIGLVGYDQKKKKYISTWVDSLSTITLTESDYDPKAKSFKSAVQDVEPKSKKKVTGHDILRIVDNDHLVQEMYRKLEGGKEYKAIEIQYEREKEKEKEKK